MNFSQHTQAIRSQIDKALQELFEDREPMSLYQPMQHLLSSGGKRIRPLLVILSCEAVGGMFQTCFKAALAVELLHTFTLVHDDIMDHDDLRRGRETVHKKWDEAMAILAGDGLVTMAYQTLLETEHNRFQEVLRLFTDGLMTLCEGQARDKEYEARSEISLEEYNQMIYQKTAKLIEVSCEMGGILGDGSSKERETLKQFGTSLGLAFQIQDDLLDILSEESILGKPIGSDLIEGKKTYITVHFYSTAAQTDIDEFRMCLSGDIINEEQIETIRELLKKNKTLHSARSSIQGHISDALQCLDNFKSTQARENLKLLSLQLKDRIS